MVGLTCTGVIPISTSEEINSENANAGKQSWLLRWFESKLFDMSYAVIYLFNSKEMGVQTYIVNRIFSFPPREVDFYLQQLVNMYIHMHDVAEVIHPYLVCHVKMKYSLLFFFFFLLFPLLFEKRHSFFP